MGRLKMKIYHLIWAKWHEMRGEATFCEMEMAYAGNNFFRYYCLDQILLHHFDRLNYHLGKTI